MTRTMLKARHENGGEVELTLVEGNALLTVRLDDIESAREVGAEDAARMVAAVLHTFKDSWTKVEGDLLDGNKLQESWKEGDNGKA